MRCRSGNHRTAHDRDVLDGRRARIASVAALMQEGVARPRGRDLRRTGRHEGNAMFSHVMVGTDDLEASKKFYDAVLGTLGIGPGFVDDGRRVFYLSPTGAAFAVTKPIDGAPASSANGGTIGFAVADPATVDAWHAAGVAL